MNKDQNDTTAFTPSVLVTGASSGIGYQFALQLAAQPRGRHLIITARRKERLEKLEEEIKAIWAKNPAQNPELKVYVFCADLALEKERAELLKRIELERLDVDLLINNAGFGSIGKFSESSLEWEEKMVEVNCKAPLHLMRHFIPKMIKRYRDTKSPSAIINVSSIASFQSVPYMSTYAATKSFLTSLNLAIQAEVAQDGIQLLALCPGPTESEFHRVVGLKQKVEVVPSMSASAVVREALDSIGTGRSITINGTRNKIMVHLNRFVPRMTAARIGEKLLRPYLQRIE